MQADGKINYVILTVADDYIVEKLGYILRNDKDYYRSFNIYRINNKGTVHELGLNETPYFMKINERLISQYEMSSGECLLLSLLHFIYHSIFRRSLDEKRPALMLIDEIELALHPVATARFLELLYELIDSRGNLTIYLTSHSPEVINKINPQNMYMLEQTIENSVASLHLENPCYPSYAIREVYRHNGYDDYLLLVEDDLARIVVETLIDNIDVKKSKLIHISPVGGWHNVLKLQDDLIRNNVLGIAKEIISILDGDIEQSAKESKQYSALSKLFLPIKSIEKYMHKVLITDLDNKIFKTLNDNLFQLRSLKEIVQEYKNSGKSDKDNNGKVLYKDYLIPAIKERKIDENQFVSHISKIVIENVDCTSTVIS